MSPTRRSFIKTGTISLAALGLGPVRAAAAGASRLAGRAPGAQEPRDRDRAADARGLRPAPREGRAAAGRSGLRRHLHRRGDEPPLLHQGRLVAERARLRRRPQPQEGPRLGLPGLRGRAGRGARPGRPGGQDVGGAREPLRDDRRRPQGPRRRDRQAGHGPGPARLRGPRAAPDPDGGRDRRRRARHRGLPRHQDGQRDRLHGPGQPHHQDRLSRRLQDAPRGHVDARPGRGHLAGDPEAGLVRRRRAAVRAEHGLPARLAGPADAHRGRRRPRRRRLRRSRAIAPT